MDHTEVGIVSPEGYTYLVNVIDARSGFCWLFPLAVKTKTAREVVDCLTSVLLDTGMTPEQLVSDSAKEFLSAWVKSLCERFGIEQSKRAHITHNETV
jgi:transposase InsO family protein